MSNDLTRRKLLGVASTGLLATRVARPISTDKLAILGGRPVRTAPFPSWPVIADNDERAWINVLRGGKWNRYDGDCARRFEDTWAVKLGAKHCLATANGTSALIISLNALGIGPGDEVIVPPYTFVATVNAVLIQHAMPVFVDTDPETCQIDAHKIETGITERTRCILPVHLGGSPADLDAILEIGRKHNIPVLEDACQAHLAEWRHRKVSTLGALGCFSFQASKNLNSGEGGAILTNDTDLYRVCESFHNNGQVKGSSGYMRSGANLRITEFQAALLAEQLQRVEEQSRTREQNAAHLTKQLSEIPGIRPARMYEGATRNAYHLYMFRYDATQFSNLPRAQFLKALRAEGVPCSSGYTPLNKQPFLKHTFDSRAYRAMYPEKQLAGWGERNHCPANDKLCEEAVWFTQTNLLGPREDMDQIADAIRKIQRQAGMLVA